MKMRKITRITSIVIMVLISLSYLSADIYIRDKEKTDAYKIGDREVPAGEVENEIWVGKHRATYITPGRIYIYNKKTGHFRLLDTREKSYLESKVPMDMSRLFSPETAAALNKLRVKGKVIKTGETRTILKRTCRAYKVLYWTDAGGGITNETKGKAWVAEDLEFDFSIFNELMDCIRQTFNRDEAFRKELQKMKGVQMRLEFTHSGRGVVVNSSSEVVEISEKDPPAGIYSIPPDYTNKETL